MCVLMFCVLLSCQDGLSLTQSLLHSLMIHGCLLIFHFILFYNIITCKLHFISFYNIIVSHFTDHLDLYNILVGLRIVSIVSKAGDLETQLVTFMN